MGVDGTKLQLNSRTVAKEVRNDMAVTPPRPVSAKVNVKMNMQLLTCDNAAKSSYQSHSEGRMCSCV